jgi:hypothetical protein
LSGRKEEDFGISSIDLTGTNALLGQVMIHCQSFCFTLQNHKESVGSRRFSILGLAFGYIWYECPYVPQPSSKGTLAEDVHLIHQNKIEEEKTDVGNSDGGS